jgi:VWFA-related protein
MRRFRHSAALSALGLLVGTVAAQDQHQRPTFRGRTDLVNVDVAVHSGRTAVSGLSAGDFEVLDNGVAQTIQSLSIGALPIDLTVIVDVSNNVVGSGLANRFASDLRRLEPALRSEDRIRVLQAGTTVTEVVPMRPVSGAGPDARVTFGGGGSVSDALVIAMMRPADLDRRRLVVVFTQGVDYYSVVDRDDVVSVARRADVLLHAIIAEHRVNAVAGRVVPMAAAAFIDAAEATGGDWRELKGDVIGAVREVVARFRSRYLLRYTPQGVTPGGWHELGVRVPRNKSYEVRARRGYFAG